MARLLDFLLLVLILPFASALDTAVAKGRFLANNETQGAITLNGIWYSRSNSTTDVNQMDPLMDAEACTRDATLMSQVGINLIYVTAIDPDQNHDDCFSIFNSVGIYVMMMLRKDGVHDTTYDDFADSYTTDFLRGMFLTIDAVKDYENLLGFDLGVLPNIGYFAMPENQNLSYAGAQKMYRAFIRDVKEYVAINAPRPILTSGTLNLVRNDELLDASDLTSSHIYHLSCAIDGNQNDYSRADYVSFYKLTGYETDVVEKQNFTYVSLEAQLTNSTVPSWLQMYGVSDEADTIEYELRPELLDDTLFLYNTSSQLILPNGGLSGGARFAWTNVNLGVKSLMSNWGIVITDSEGNVQLTENFNRLREIFSRMNTDSWLSGNAVGQVEDHPACNRDGMFNTTTEFYFDEQTTMTIATDWELPTRPPGLDALITTGVGGKRGQMVDVTITTIVHTVRDSDGNVLTDLSLSPSSSASRTPTGALPSETSGEEPPAASDEPLSGGAKAGIGIGAAIGGLALIGAVAFFFFRRRRNSMGRNKLEDGTDGVSGLGGQNKAELATGPEVELYHAELAAAEKKPHELYSPAGAHAVELNGVMPVELPVNERSVELPVTVK